MTISIDSNVIVALWRQADPFNSAAATMLNRSRLQSRLLVSAPVYVELLGDPSRDEAALDTFLEETGISIDWTLDERVWREAGRANRGYIRRRQSSGGSLPRRLVTDFLIGAHALVGGHTLLTFDQRLYAAAFPNLAIIAE
jgi:predicted nucleic acid-binding protein